MNRVSRVLKVAIFSWGIFSLISVILFGGYLVYVVGPGNAESRNTASPRDVRFVMNGCKLREDQIEAVISSYQSGRSFFGGHLEMHAIRVSGLEQLEFTLDEYGIGWERCDQVQGVLAEAISLVSRIEIYGITWFPELDEIRSEQFFVYPNSIYCSGTKPSAVRLTFAKPNEEIIYFLDYQDG